LAITMVCATAFLDAERARRVRTAADTGAEHARTIRVNDEAWRALPVAGLGEYYQAAFKLARQTGVQHWMVLHRISDLDASGDAGSRRQALAKGLLAETGTVVAYRQHPEELARPRAALVLLVTLACMATAMAVVVGRRERTSGGRAARFAARADLTPLRVGGPEGGRVILGTHRHALIAAEPRASILVVGPSQSGK